MLTIGLPSNTQKYFSIVYISNFSRTPRVLTVGKNQRSARLNKVAAARGCHLWRIFEKRPSLLTETTMTSKDKLIRFVRDVLPMTLSKAEQLVEKYQPKEVCKNEHVLKEGSICKASYFIDEGFMRAYTHDGDGNDVTTGFSVPGNFANDLISFFNQVPSRENIQALTDCKTWYMTYEDMQTCFHSIPEFREFGRLNIINNYGELKQRMLSMVQETAEKRYADLVHRSPEILQQAPLKNIASYLGITDSSLSRIRKEFVKK